MSFKDNEKVYENVFKNIYVKNSDDIRVRVFKRQSDNQRMLTGGMTFHHRSLSGLSCFM